MKENKKHIGLVLPAIPGYSETFFYSKINGLLEHGHIVKLFINQNNKIGYPENWKVYFQPQVNLESSSPSF